MELSEHWGRPGSPASQGVGAQLILAVLLAALMPLFLLTVPIETHAVKLDLPPLPETVVPTGRPPPQAFLLTSLSVPDVVPVPSRPVHDLIVAPNDEVRFDGKKVDLLGLRERLDVIVSRDSEWVDLRPDPNARYELFAEILAITKRARLERLRLDNRAFRTAFDEGGVTAIADRCRPHCRKRPRASPRERPSGR